MKRYNNYHKHDHYGNPKIIDTIAKVEDYCERACELGHTTIFTTNHGFQGNLFDTIANAKKYNLKAIVGVEAYYVPDRFEDDRTNRHIIIIAKTNKGIMQINDIMSEANISGMYVRPRIDDELLFSLSPEDVFVTTACIAGVWNNIELVIKLHNHFKENFYLEVQSHNTYSQKEMNSRILKISKELGIKIIHANDSHYIYEEDKKYRDLFLKGKGFNYTDEEDFVLDYPDYETVLKRYEKQGVLTKNEAIEALDNTLIFDSCEEQNIINNEIKLPQISDNPSKELRKIIYNAWRIEKQNIPDYRIPEYERAIEYELDIIEKTHMENYFIIDYKVVKLAQEKYGGTLTRTGRGSAPSFYVTKLLGLTDIDRLDAPLTLFPTRFMSVERILGARSLPDIDLNTSDSEPFIQATKELLGAENCEWMISWKPLKDSSAFRLYCRALGMHVSEYDEVAKNIKLYENDKKWRDLIKESSKFVGVVESISESPCSMLLYNKPVRKEIGLIRTEKKICCLLDGYSCDVHKYLKNDYLTAMVWSIIKETCDLAGISIPTINELNEKLDDKTYDIYKEGLTCSINQVDSPFATPLVKIFKPKTVSEVSAFVSILRPGCASLRNDFINRKPFTTGKRELDELLTDGGGRMIFQELIMKYLIWLNVKETESYDIIKKISKKKFKEEELLSLKDTLKKEWINKFGDDFLFENTWITVEEASKYSFNAAHSLCYAYDSLYGAYLKAHYPLEYYTASLNHYKGDEERTKRLTKELNTFGIKLFPIKFGFSKDKYSMDRGSNSIYKGVESVKYMNKNISSEIYRISKEKDFNSFVELLEQLKGIDIDSRQIEILIKLNYFECFGNIRKLLYVFSAFKELYDRKQLNKSNDESKNEILRKFSKRETKARFSEIDIMGLLNFIESKANFKDASVKEKIEYQIDYLGYVDISDKKYRNIVRINSVNTNFAPMIDIYTLANGENLKIKIKKTIYEKNPLEKGDIIEIKKYNMKPKYVKNSSGGFDVVPGETVIWVDDYEKVIYI